MERTEGSPKAVPADIIKVIHDKRLPNWLAKDEIKQTLVQRAGNAIQTFIGEEKKELTLYLFSGLAARDDTWNNDMRDFSLALLSDISLNKEDLSSIADSYKKVIKDLPNRTPSLENIIYLIKAGILFTKSRILTEDITTLWSNTIKKIPMKNEAVTQEIENLRMQEKKTPPKKERKGLGGRKPSKDVIVRRNKLREKYDSNKTDQELAEELGEKPHIVSSDLSALRKAGLLPYRTYLEKREGRKSKNTPPEETIFES